MSLLGDAAFNGNLLYFDPSTSPPSEITRTTNPLSENFVQTVYEGMHNVYCIFYVAIIMLIALIFSMIVYN